MTTTTLNDLNLPALAEIKASLAKDSLPDFIREAWPLVEPGTDLVWNWHLDELCKLLEAVSRGEIKRIIVNIPPGCSKSLMISVFWPAWEWATNPSLRFLTASYSDANTIRDNRRLRSIIQSDWYQNHYGVELASDQWAKVRFDTAAKGWRIATSVGGMGTGEHPDRIIIDDPHKADEARSSVARNNVSSWFENTISTRKSRDPAIIIVMQRLHEDDLSGRLLSRGGWEHLCLPMRYELPNNDSSDTGRWDCPCHEQPDKRDQRTEPGELLWPGLWSEDKVREVELDLGPFGASGQLQQRPVPIGGGLFKREWFDIVDEMPALVNRRCRGWDTAGTKDAGDYTAGVRISRSGVTYYVEHVVRDRTENADSLIHRTAKSDGRRCMVREEQEPGSSGKAVIRDHTIALAGYDYAGVTISGDKIARARPFRAQCEAGNVKLVRGSWNTAYLDELCAFPLGPYDDQVDASSCAFNALALEPRKKKRQARLIGTVPHVPRW